MNYVVILLVAAGTYLMRFLPLRFAKAFERLRASRFLSYSSTALIAALFANSFLSSIKVTSDLTPAIFSLLVVFMVHKLWRNLGVSILAGVTTHLLLSYLTAGI